MGPESKGRAWFGKIYNKLETILVEVDTFTSQSTLCLNSSDPPGWESVRVEPEEFAEDQSSSSSSSNHDRSSLPSSDSPSDPPSPQNFDILGNIRVEERVQGDNLKENLSAPSLPDGKILSSRAPLLEEDYCDGDLSSDITLGDDEEYEESQITDTFTTQRNSAEESSVSSGEKIEDEFRFESCRDVVSTKSQSTRTSLESVGTVETFDEDPVLAALSISLNESNLNLIATKIPDDKDNAANMRSFNEDNPDDVIDGKSDVTPSDTNTLDGMSFQEDPSYVDDNALYAVRLRTKKLRSFKKKILDALTAKRRREEEYEHLPIWFGDADMGSDLVTGEDSAQIEAIDSESSQVHESEDYQWELL